MRVTTWAEYGLIVSLHLAKDGGETPTPARDLAERECLPADYVEQILLKLRRAGLVQSVRGAKGGYFPVPPVDSLHDLRSAMCLALEELGLGTEVPTAASARRGRYAHTATTSPCRGRYASRSENPACRRASRNAVATTTDTLASEALP